MDILKVKNLTKKFGPPAGGFKAVDDISFSLKEGEILGFLGPNGAGKTTTIQMLLSVLTPTSGSIEYFGKKLDKHREEILEQVNFSSTYTNLPWRLSVKENLTFISYLYTIGNRKKRLERIVDIFRLKDILNEKMHELSSGQLTRVNLAKAFINFPKVLLLDEPTASLDPEVATYIRDFLLQERQKFKVSIIFTSHNMAEIEEVCDRVVFINYGKIVADDTPENLAKTIEITHVELFIKDGLKRAIEYCQKRGLSYKIEGRYITVDINETNIPDFLKDIMQMGAAYTEISINKPTLEDYFIQMAKKEKVNYPLAKKIAYEVA
jgi:ABC-2 type transport system ATP-binding protein